jgi:predicted RNA-binding Zn ribbon-like protein
MPDASQNTIAFDAGPQPGGREPAPGRLALVQAFVNSNHDLEFEFGADLFRDRAALADWLSRRGLIEGGAGVSSRELARARAVRGGLRALLIANNGGPLDEEAVRELDGAAGSASFGVRLASRRAELVAHASGVDGALATVLAAVTEAMFDGTWSRFKACRQHDCQWGFFDHSRNAAGSWCSMQVCGGRAKQRAYYRRAHQ